MKINHVLFTVILSLIVFLFFFLSYKLISKPLDRKYSSKNSYLENIIKKNIDLYNKGENILCLKYKNVYVGKGPDYPKVVFSKVVSKKNKDIEYIVNQNTLDLLHSYFYDKKKKIMYPLFNCRDNLNVLDNYSYDLIHFKSDIFKDRIIFSETDYKELENESKRK